MDIGTASILQAQHLYLVSQVPGTEGREVCSSLELMQILHLDVLFSSKITMTLGNSNLPKTSLKNDLVLLYFKRNLEPDKLFISMSICT